jgi:uncharacterized protein (DUF2461 family)
MLALLGDLEPEFGPARLSRPNRDIRFSADKSPYKTNIYADARGGGYVALDASGLVAAGGHYMMEAPQLARFREAVALDRSGKQLVAIVTWLRDKVTRSAARSLSGYRRRMRKIIRAGIFCGTNA